MLNHCDSHNKFILLIEDDPGHAELIMRGLDRMAPARVHHISDGEKAIEFLFPSQPGVSAIDNPGQVTLILLDLRLPRVDGLEILRRLKEDAALRKIPVVILSTSEDKNDIRKAYEYHVNSYLVKPSDFDDFAAMLMDMQKYWLNWNHRLTE